MVEQDFLNRVEDALGALEKARGQVALFAIFKMDDLTDKWTVVVGAGWASEVPFDEVFTQIRADLLKTLKDEINTIARIGVFDLNDHFTHLILEKYKTGDEIKEAQQVNGNLVHEGYIIKAVTQN